MLEGKPLIDFGWILGGSEGTELVLSRLAKTASNQEFLETLNRDV